MSLSERDTENIWHPYTQHKTSEKPIGIVRGSGAYLFDEQGKKYIDAISSWWVNLHGHSHPYIAEKIHEQFLKLEHVIFAGFTHEPAVELAERLLKILPSNQKKVFYSDNGSTSVEVALKMAFQYWHNQGEAKTKVIALKDAYHGDTFGAMSVSGRGAFTDPFVPFLFDVNYLNVFEREEMVLHNFKKLLVTGEVAAFVFEPLVLGAAGMKMYAAELLQKLLEICREYSVLAIADEVFTGFGRTGKMFASDYLMIKPDMICLSKGLTAGALPMGTTSCTENIFKAFLSDEKMKTFFHGHSFTANPLACAAANASLDLFEKENVFDKIEMITQSHLEFAANTKSNPAEIRTLGTILAVEVKTAETSGYTNNIRDYLYPFFMERGVVLRPLGNVIYLVPPYCISREDLDFIYQTIKDCLTYIEKNIFINDKLKKEWTEG
jgi:adenosylmethionine---8-amino-7-oxononanoate aminotransferase